MKFKTLMFLFSLMLLMCGPAWAQDGAISLDHVDGLYGTSTDTVNINQTITFHIRLNNNTGNFITGSTNGFRIYSLTGAEWDTTTAVTTGAITLDMYDGGYIVNPFSDDGMGADTIGFGGFKMFKPGIPDGFDQIIATIDIGPIDAAYHKGQICIDSSYYRPAGIWKWSTSGGDKYPTWDGPHCFTIFDPDAPETNEVPVLALIGPQATDEGVLLTFDVSATDADSDPLTLRMNSADLPGAATLTDNGDGTGTFNWTPTFDDAGVYTAQIVADDGTDTTYEDVTVTVTDVPQPPVLDAIGAQTTAECQTLELIISGTDPEGGFPVFSTVDETIPGGPIVVANHGDGTATIDWTPNPATVGVYSVTFVATAGALADSEVVAITVTANAAPTIDPSIAGQSFGECGFLTFTVVATDPESGPITLSSDALPGAATFDPLTGVFEWTSVAGDALLSPYDIMFYADDDCGNQASQNVHITLSANQPPVLAAIMDQSVAECDVISFTVSATDPDGGTPVLTNGPLPGTATFDAGTGAFAWTTVAGDAAGSPYTVDFYATDGCDLADTITVNIIIAADQAPVLTAVPDQNVIECETVTFTVTATDPDGGSPVLSSGTLPGTATFDVGTGVFEWTPIAGDAVSSPYSVDFTATDPCGLTDDITVNINVAANVAPVVATIDDFNASECVEIMLGVSATDTEGGTMVLTTSTLPTGADFVDNGDGTGTFTWTPVAGDAGAYPIDFIATDDCGLDSTEPVTITIDANQEPALDGDDPITVAECASIVGSYSATDFEGLDITYSLLTPPEWATLTDNGDGTATVDYSPVFGDAGVYTVSVVATDACGGADTMAVAVTVSADAAPTFTPDAASYNLTECVEDTVTFTYDDPEGTTLTFEVLETDPGDIVFTDNGDGTGFFVGTPPSGEAGTDTLLVVTTDECGVADTTGVEIIVAEDAEPVFDAVDPLSLQQGEVLTVVVTATDPESAAITMTFDSTDLAQDGSQFTFTDSGNGVAVLEWTTQLITPVETYSISFYASDGCSEVELIVVADLITGVAPDNGAELPDQFYLTQNFPNPFNPVTQIEFGIPEKSHVTLAVYNVLGQRIRTLVDETLPANNYTAEWDGNSENGVRVASGIYFYKLETSLYTETKKMILLK